MEDLSPKSISSSTEISNKNQHNENLSGEERIVKLAKSGLDSSKRNEHSFYINGYYAQTVHYTTFAIL